MQDCRKDGSFTVEATLIMTLVVACLMICVYGCLYLHDKTVLDSTARLAAQKGRILLTEDQDMKTGQIDWKRFEEKGILWRLLGTDESDAVREFAQQQIQGKLILCKDPSFTVQTGGSSITVSYQAKTGVTGMYPFGSLPTLSEVKGTVKEMVFEEEEFVRLVRALLNDSGKKDAEEKGG
ncbi:MAG: pilus assembly protein [Lachnospiraceae bacterium]|nr:pilus assembly protein [Lachnospiraceae bacterium]